MMSWPFATRFLTLAIGLANIFIFGVYSVYFVHKIIINILHSEGPIRTGIGQ